MDTTTVLVDAAADEETSNFLMLDDLVSTFIEVDNEVSDNSVSRGLTVDCKSEEADNSCEYLSVVNNDDTLVVDRIIVDISNGFMTGVESDSITDPLSDSISNSENKVSIKVNDDSTHINDSDVVKLLSETIKVSVVILKFDRGNHESDKNSDLV